MALHLPLAMGGNIVFNPNWDVLGRRCLVQTSAMRHSASSQPSPTPCNRDWLLRGPWRKHLSVLPGAGNTNFQTCGFYLGTPPPFVYSEASLTQRKQRGYKGLQDCQPHLLFPSVKQTEAIQPSQETHATNTPNNSQEPGGPLHADLSCVS